MSGKRKSVSGFDCRFKKYKAGQNIIDELMKIGDFQLNSKVNSIFDNYIRHVDSISNSNIKEYHYFLTLLLHDAKSVVNKHSKMNQFLKNCMCSVFTSIYRDALREKEPEVFKERNMK